MTTRRTLAASSLAAFALVALSACQGTAPAPSTSATTGTSATSTSSTTSSAKPSTSAATGSSGSSSSSSSGSSAAPEVKDVAEFADKVTKAMKDLKTYKTTIKGSGTSNGQTVTTDTTLTIDQSDANNIKAQGIASVGAVAVETIMIGSDSYVKQPSGKYKKAAITAQEKDALLQAAGDQYKKASAIKKAGNEKVDGVDTTHYVLTFPAGVLGSAETPMDVWVDSKMRIVQQKTVTDISGAKAEATMTVTDYDKPVDIKAPSADQIEG